jgi:DNA-binding NarL/FixJ family response regulator
MATVRILLADDFAPFRSYVRRMLEGRPEWQVVGETADGVAALQTAQELQPDLVLLDIDLPRLNGIEVAQRLGTMAPPPKILFLTSDCAPEASRAALAFGVLGCVAKWHADRDLLRAMKAVMAGKQFVSE